MNRKNAFTLIELLVVIAIIAILAAILFPVFAQAKAAAKASTALSNHKQIATSMAIYSGDFDDNKVPRNRQDQSFNAMGQVTGVVNEYNWKQLTQPYAKNQQLFKDPVNPAGRYADFHSDPGARAFFGWTPVDPGANLKFARGYAIANIFINGSFADNKGVSITSLDNIAGVLNTLESKDYFEDMGPYIGWSQNVDSGYSWMGAAAPVTGLQWNWGGDKWDNKATVATFQDTHAKRLAWSEICGKQFVNQPAGSTSVDYWGLAKTDQANYGWATAMCDTLPQKFR